MLWSWIFELLPLLLLTRHPFLLMLPSLRSFMAMKEERFALPHLDATFHLILCCHCNGAQAATIHVFGGKLQGSNTLFGKQEVFLRQSALSLRCSWSLWDEGHKGRWRIQAQHRRWLVGVPMEWATWGLVLGLVLRHRGKGSVSEWGRVTGHRGTKSCLTMTEVSAMLRTARGAEVELFPGRTQQLYTGWANSFSFSVLMKLGLPFAKTSRSLTQRYHQPVTPVCRWAAFLLGTVEQQAGGGKPDTGKSNFLMHAVKLLKDPVLANLKQFGLHSLSTLQCINSFRVFSTFHRLKDTADVSSVATPQALISVQIPSLLNSRSFYSKIIPSIQVQGTSRGGHSRVSPHTRICVSILSLASQSWERSQSICLSASSPLCPLVFHTNSSGDGWLSMPKAASWRAVREESRVMAGIGTCSVGATFHS